MGLLIYILNHLSLNILALISRYCSKNHTRYIIYFIKKNILLYGILSLKHFNFIFIASSWWSVEFKCKFFEFSGLFLFLERTKPSGTFIPKNESECGWSVEPVVAWWFLFCVLSFLLINRYTANAKATMAKIWLPTAAT